jgi:hypothetical protein
VRHRDDLGDGPDDFDIDFADPGGRSALRAATKSNPRNLPCPTCGQPNRLTPADRALGYQCDACADRLEGLGGGYLEY